MTAKQLVRIGIALLVLIFLWGLVEILSRRGNQIDRVSLLPTISETEVDTVEFRRSGDTVALVRSAANGWTVNGYPASKEAVSGFFAALADSGKAELVARSPASHTRMGVDSTGTSLRLVRGGQTLAHLVGGQRGTAFESRYVRRADQDDVYLLEGPLAPLFDRSVTDWRDKRIATVDPAAVARVSVDRGKRGYSLVRSDSAWRFADGRAADSVKVRRTLDEFRTLEAQGTAFATLAQVDSARFAPPDRRVTLLSEHGDTLLALVFDSTAAGFWTRHASGGTVYQLYRWRVDALAPADSVLLAKGK